MIAIVDYRAGNLASVAKAFAHLGHDCEITSDGGAIERADRIVLPGVGHFRATGELRHSGLCRAIEGAISRGAPFLGICVGMQWMFAGSEEAPEVRGLAAFPGRCAKFPAAVKSPHVGWNTVRRARPSRLLDGLPDEFFVYFTHSYYAPEGDGSVGVTGYGLPFAAAVERGNLFGVQFHPEKSGDAGLRLLDNFARIPC